MKIRYTCFSFFIIPTYCNLIPNNRVITDPNSKAFDLVEGITYDIIHLKSGSKLDNNDEEVYANSNDDKTSTWSLRKVDDNRYNIINVELSRNLDSNTKDVYISNSKHDSTNNPYQKWFFINTRDDLYNIVHGSSYNLDSNGKEVYISKPENNYENNTYQQWLFEPSNYNLTAVVMDMKYPSDLKDKLEQYKSRTSLLSGSYIIENESNVTIEQTIDRTESKLNSYSVEIKKSESFKVTEKIYMSANIGKGILGMLGINTRLTSGIGFDFTSRDEKIFRESVTEEVSYNIRQKITVPPFNSVRVDSTVDKISISIPFEAKIRVTGKADRLDEDGNVLTMIGVEINALKCYLRKENYDIKKIKVEKDSLIIDTVGTLEVDAFGLETSIEAVPLNPETPKKPDNPNLPENPPPKSPKNPESTEPPKSPKSSEPPNIPDPPKNPDFLNLYLLCTIGSIVILYIGYQIGFGLNRIRRQEYQRI